MFGFTPNGVFEPYCGRNQTVHFTGSTGFQYVETTEVSIGTGAFIQFDLNTGCSGTPNLFTVELQFANRDGSNGGLSSALAVGSGSPWQYVLPTQCNPGTGSGTCTSWTWGEPGYSYSAGSTVPSYGSWTGGSVFSSLDYSVSYWRTATWTRVTLPLPATSTAGGRRYRLIVQRSGGSEWAVSNLYIGSGCPYGCGGRGLCVGGQCVCDGNAVLSGTTCVAAGSLPTELRETFEESILRTRWLIISGGSLYSAVVVGAASQSMYFPGTLNPPAMQFSSRRLVTVDMDTRNATYVEYVLYTTAYSASYAQISLSFSVDGGLSWQLLSGSGATTSSSNRLQKFSVQLPVEAQQLGCRFQWWQPQYDSASSSGWVSLYWFSILKSPVYMYICIYA